MKINTEKFNERVAKVSFNIIGFYYVNPTEHRYERLKKILDKMIEVNDDIEDNRYRHDNWNVLTTVKQILIKLGTITYETTAEHVNAPSHKNRKVVIECGTLCLSLNNK